MLVTWQLVSGGTWAPRECRAPGGQGRKRHIPGPWWQVGIALGSRLRAPIMPCHFVGQHQWRC